VSDWISVEDELPEYGEPVLIYSSGVVQNVTYTLDADEEETIAWFEPYHFEHDDNCKVGASEVNHWMPLPEPPNKGE